MVLSEKNEKNLHSICAYLWDPTLNFIKHPAWSKLRLGLRLII